MINMQFTLAKGVYAEVNITGTPNEGHIELLKQYLEVSKTALGIDAALSPAPSAPQGEQGAADSKVDRTVKDSLTVAEYRCTRCNGLAEWDASQSVWRHMSGDPLSDRLIEQSFCDKYGYPIDVRVAATPAVEHPDTASGAALIAAERLRQVSVEGWTPEHDAEHARAEMIRAGVAYAEYARALVVYGSSTPPYNWPWEQAWWKPSPGPIRNLVKAGALIAAEIDRLTLAAQTGDSK